MEKQYGCHCDLEPGMSPDKCVIDTGRVNDCVHAIHLVAAGKRKENCCEWKEVESRLSEINQLHAKLAERDARITSLTNEVEENKTVNAATMETMHALYKQRITALEAGLREAREALIPYMKLVDGTQVKNQAAQCYDKIDKLLCPN